MSDNVVPITRATAARPTLAPILSLTAAAMNNVNAIILDRMQSEIPLIPALAGHLIAGGGKRMRPMLTLAGAEVLGYHGARATTSWRRRWNSSTPPPCCTMMWWMAAKRGAARKRPISSSVTRPRCWWAISCFPAHLN